MTFRFLAPLLIVSTAAGQIDNGVSPAVMPKSAPSFFIGVNYSGLELGSVPGTVHFDYFPPSAADLTYLHSRGLNTIRLPVRWERLQPDLQQSLDPIYLAFITQAANQAAALDMGLIIDVHNGARYGGNRIGSTEVPNTSFADLWRRLAIAMRDQPGIIGYDLMNEPAGLRGNLGPAMQAATAAIRAVDVKHAIYIEGDNFSNAYSWQALSQNNDLAIADPVDKIVYEAHSYLDCDGSGTHFNWAIQSTNPAQPEPDATPCTNEQRVTVDTGVQRVTPFVQWCVARGFKCIVGETGAGHDDPHWLISLDNELNYLRANGIGVTYWTAGSAYEGYGYTVQPQAAAGQAGGLIDTPQMAVLEKYSGFTAVPYVITGPSAGTAGKPASFAITTHGYIAAPTEIVLSDNDGGGSFSAKVVTLPPGFGGSAGFSYAAPDNGLHQLRATAGDANWVNPAPLEYSTTTSHDDRGDAERP